ncbi:MAG: UDP-N-acetylmuramate dehydrogenase [Treponema sp.]
MQRNVKLKDFTSFKIGGNADIYITPSSCGQLQAALRFIETEKLPAVLLGGGTNMLISDTGIRGAVIHTHLMNTLRLRTADGEPAVEAECGTSMQALVDFCARHGLSGLEDFAGLPGTVGGAVFMNARCYEKSISDVLYSASVLTFDNTGYTLESRTYNKTEWGYKRSPFQPADKAHAVLGIGRNIIVSAVFKLTAGNKTHIRRRMEERIRDRTEKGHFKLPSAGSTFKNNHAFGKPSGKLIDEAGLRGFQIGGAQVAPWHGNFIVNTGSATAAEVKELISTVQKRVKQCTGFELEPEVIFAG